MLGDKGLRTGETSLAYRNATEILERGIADAAIVGKYCVEQRYAKFAQQGWIKNRLVDLLPSAREDSPPPRRNRISQFCFGASWCVLPEAAALDVGAAFPYAAGSVKRKSAPLPGEEITRIRPP